MVERHAPSIRNRACLSLLTIGVFLSANMVVVPHGHAEPYGSGPYGAGDYNIGNQASSSSSSSSRSDSGGGGGGRRGISRAVSAAARARASISANGSSSSETMLPGAKVLLLKMRGRLAARVERRLQESPSLEWLLRRVLERLDARIAALLK